MLTKERLREVLDYNPDTGVFTRVKSEYGKRAGDEAGTSDKDGYIRIMIDRRHYMAHRLAVFFTDGYLPEDTVDHIDRVPWHNWRLNLREATQQCQMRNCKMQKNNTSGVKGVAWDNWNAKWKAHVTVGGSARHLGRFNSLIEAAYARYAAEQCLGFEDLDENTSAKRYIRAQGGIV